ncbi:MAG: PIN domain-containing protein [Verrucomicrobia bacterium]|nr:PIN domain-containing protein [Verrucomicrobiota bacterium]MBT7701756.1 PIN domain-containing protein [Verrucomicrobiota bacterium]
MKVLVDTNVILDVLLDRQPFSEDATRILALVEESKIEGFLCATTVTTVDYLLGRALTVMKARSALRRLLDIFEVAPVNRPVLEQALRSEISDFEDAVLEQSGRLVAVDAIVTRNIKDFRKSTVTVLDPVELLSAVDAIEAANP